MTLTIDTTEDNFINLKLEGKISIKRRVKALRLQSEKLLPLILNTLEKHNLTWSDLTLIKVAAQGGGFTSLRIGVLTANALAYALKIPIEDINGMKAISFDGGAAVKPIYTSEPNIGIAVKNNC